ncbi:septal ring lytic transglycosylase RlpA family protein [Pelagibius sp.]|uniref:septal ring lytic transglycosylase RlpA family protein n=1 Tax=Pelagibius sp. TaxID=1931238 RepID=UPI003B506221
MPSRNGLAVLLVLGVLSGCAATGPTEKRHTENQPVEGQAATPAPADEPSAGRAALRASPAARPARPGAALAALPPEPDDPDIGAAERVTETFSGLASWYGKRFHGRLTASGSRFDMNAMTAAHRSLPFGTRVRVTNESNQRSIVVTINDRGPFIKPRIIDLSLAAAEALGFVDEGLTKVRVEVLAEG